MEFDIYIAIIIFSIFCALNFGIYSLFFAIRKKKRNLFSISVILFSFCLFIYALEVTNVITNYSYLIWVNAPILYCIGPFSYLHVKEKLKLIDILHFLPFLAFLIYLTPFYLSSDSNKVYEYQHTFQSNSSSTTLTYFYLLHISIYFFLSFLMIRKRKQQYYHYFSNPSKKLNINQLEKVYLSFFVVTSISFVYGLLVEISNLYIFGFDYFTLTLLSILFIVLQLYHNYDSLELTPPYFNIAENKLKIINKKLIKTLEKVMKDEKLYQNPNLRIKDVSNKLNISLNELSASINNHYHQSFFEYINTLRIEEIKKELLNPNNKHLTFYAIANKSGFKSNSSFYRVFKKYTGNTPKSFIKEYS
ncbi:MAG: helix-turn-helix transcriptional regulator [Flavobacteriaceae bacterium]|nr:helix-turn-helix transcriptional regulator [Flavobacteriaceae bacterium]